MRRMEKYTELRSKKERCMQGEDKANEIKGKIERNEKSLTMIKERRQRKHSQNERNRRKDQT